MDVWLLGSISESILTSKTLLLGPAKDYPSSLALTHVSLLCLSQAIAACIGKSDNAKSTNLPRRQLGAFWLAALITIMSVCIISAYKTLRFAGSLPTAVLLLSMRLDMIGRTVSSNSGLRDFAAAIVRMILFVTGFALVLLWDYRLNITSRDMAVTFLVVSHTLLHVPTIATWLPHAVHLPRAFHLTYCSVQLQYWPVCLLMPLAIVAYLDEAPQPFIGVPSISSGILLLANLAFTAAAYVVQAVPRRRSIEGGWLKLACTGLVSLGSHLLPGFPTLLSHWQFLGYVVAMLACCDLSIRPAAPVDDHTSEQLLLEEQGSSFKYADFLDGQSNAPGRVNPPVCRRKGWSHGTIRFAIAAWLIFACVSSIQPTDVAQELVFSNARKAAAPVDLDIVIAAYDRSGMEIAQDINSLLDLQTLRNHTSRLHVYNKGLATSQLEKDIREHLSQHTALFVKELNNNGREGGTYLHHIES